MTAGGRAWRGAILPVGALVLMEISSHFDTGKSDSFAPPRQIFVALFEVLRDGTLATATYQTLVASLIGVIIGMTIGLIVGVLMGLHSWFGSAFELTVEFVRPIPSIALIPVGMLVLGLGYRLEISIVAFACIWPMLILSRAAIAGVEPRLLEVAQTFEMPLLARVREIVIPSIAPSIFVAMRLSITLALIVAITVEITANPSGVGYGMMLAQQSIRPDVMYSYLIWIAVLGWCINSMMVRVEKGLFRRRGEPDVLV